MATRALGGRGERFSTQEAERAGLAVLGEISLDVPEEEVAPPASDELVTVQDLLQTWVAAQRVAAASGALAQTTLTVKEAGARRLLGGRGLPDDMHPIRLRPVRLVDLSRERLAEYIADRRAPTSPDSAPATIRLDLRYLAEAWHWAQQEGLIGSMLLPMPKLPKMERVYTDYTPTPAEMELLVGAMQSTWHASALQVLWGTGARIGEVCSLTWDRLDLRGGRIRLMGKANPRWIPLTARARAGVELLPSGCGAVPLYPGDAPRQAFQTALNRACKETGLPHLTPNGIRRLAVDELRRAGVKLEVCAAITGHGIETMMKIYRRPLFSELQDALQEGTLGGKVLEGPWTASAER